MVVENYNENRKKVQVPCSRCKVKKPLDQVIVGGETVTVFHCRQCFAKMHNGQTVAETVEKFTKDAVETMEVQVKAYEDSYKRRMELAELIKEKADAFYSTQVENMRRSAAELKDIGKSEHQPGDAIKRAQEAVKRAAEINLAVTEEVKRKCF